MNRQQCFSKRDLGCAIYLTTDGSELDNQRAEKVLDAIAKTVQGDHPNAFVVVGPTPGVQNKWEMIAVQRAEVIAVFTGGPLHRKAIAAIVKTANDAYNAMTWLESAQNQAVREFNEGGEHTRFTCPGCPNH